MEVHNNIQEAVTKTIPKKKKCKKAKWLSEETLQIAEERKEVKSKGERAARQPPRRRAGPGAPGARLGGGARAPDDGPGEP